jgi:hypothetical protein
MLRTVKRADLSSPAFRRSECEDFRWFKSWQSPSLSSYSLSWLDSTRNSKSVLYGCGSPPPPDSAKKQKKNRSFTVVTAVAALPTNPPAAVTFDVVLICTFIWVAVTFTEIVQEALQTKPLTGTFTKWWRRLGR